METNRAYSLMSIKSIDEDAREITGIASTPETDRMGDIVEPDGAEYKLPIPFLWQHDQQQPIGEVYAAKKTKEGIEVKIRLARVLEPKVLVDRLDSAWAMIKARLVRGLSIGFRPLEYTFLDEGGMRFMKWEWYELSAVTIPANAQASISSIKSFDQDAIQAASGTKKSIAADVKPSGDSGKIKQVKSTPREEKEMSKTTQEQIKEFKATLVAKQTKMSDIMAKSGEEGVTLAAAEQEEFDTLSAEATEVKKHLERLEIVAASEVSKATAIPAKSGASEAAAQEVRQPGLAAQVKAAKPTIPGIQMAQVARCLGLAKGNHFEAFEIAKARYANDDAVIGILKTAVAAGTTTNSTWALPLVPTEGAVFADFVEYLRPQTILGRFGQGGVPSLRNVPFRTRLVGQTTGGTGYWVGEGKPKPVTKFDFSNTSLLPLKVANIAVATDELLRDSSPSADMLIRDSLVEALRALLDVTFIDPSVAAVSTVSPASVTNGVSAIASTGNTADDVRCDIKALMDTFIAANNAPTNGVWIMSTGIALALSLMLNPLGQPEFPGISMRGGFLFGLPVIVSEYVPTTTDGSIVVLANASDIYIGDEGGFALDVSREASLQMLDNPTNDVTGSTTATTMVSMFQTNSVAFRAERTINWAKRRASAVAVLNGVFWGACNT